MIGNPIHGLTTLLSAFVAAQRTTRDTTNCGTDTGSRESSQTGTNSTTGRTTNERAYTSTDTMHQSVRNAAVLSIVFTSTGNARNWRRKTAGPFRRTHRTSTDGTHDTTFTTGRSRSRRSRRSGIAAHNRCITADASSAGLCRTTSRWRTTRVTSGKLSRPTNTGCTGL